MNKNIVRVALNTIEELGILWARNYFAKEQQLTKEDPDKTKIAAAEFNMKEAEKQIAWYKKYTKAKK